MGDVLTVEVDRPGDFSAYMLVHPRLMRNSAKPQGPGLDGTGAVADGRT